MGTKYKKMSKNNEKMLKNGLKIGLKYFLKKTWKIGKNR